MRVEKKNIAAASAREGRKEERPTLHEPKCITKALKCSASFSYSDASIRVLVCLSEKCDDTQEHFPLLKLKFADVYKT